MIWIATLCLLAVAAWLFFNALNERRWVEAHSHDETVAADPGFLPDLSKYTASLRGEPGGEDDTPLGRAVTQVRQTGAKASDWVGKTANEARARNGGQSYLESASKSIGDAAGKLDARASRVAATDGQRDQPARATIASEGFVADSIAWLEDKLGTKTMQTRPPSDEPSRDK